MANNNNPTESSSTNGENGKTQSSRKRKSPQEGEERASNSSGNGVIEKRVRPPRLIRPPLKNRYEGEPKQPETRSCTIVGCKEPQPRCCLQASGSCTHDGYTSRWGHMSLGEHYCNECFEHFYRTFKPGFSEYNKWCQIWYDSSFLKPSVKLFISENVLPYWIQCTYQNCNKWREFSMEGEPTAELIRCFTCKTAYKNINKHHCDITEEPCVADVTKPNWMAKLTEVPLLKRSPSGPHLTMYHPEDIGLSPPTCNIILISPLKYMSPFCQILNGQSQIWIKPDILEMDELYYISKSVMLPQTYIGIRNLIVGLWHLLPNNWLTLKKVAEYLICRGLVRIYLLKAAENIMKIFTQMAVINYGLVHSPPGYSLCPVHEETVIVVGAGLAGLTAAKHLMEHGIKTMVLEAKSRIGGRIWDINNLSHGAHVVHGLTSNPLTVLCHQAKSSINEVSDVVLISLNGTIVSDEVYEKMEHQCNGIMNGALEWAKEHKEDASWYDIIVKNQKEYNDQVRSFTSEESNVFSCILNLKEIEQGVPFNRLTLLNYESPKLEGVDGSVSNGLCSIINCMAEDLDVQLETKVTSISFDNEYVNIATNQETWTASRVIITVPLAILKANKIKFYPPLPEEKVKCISELGCYCCEKIFLQFRSRFWAPLLKGGKKRFAIVSTETLPFRLFEDITAADGKLPTLVSFFSASCESVKNKCDQELKEMCIEMLRRLFANLSIKVPKPSHFFVTRWLLDPDIQCSGSYVEVGSSYSLYDSMAEDIDGKLFFAGEATHRGCPNSVTGAFLSGLREASKILNYVSPIVPLSY